MAYDFLGLVNDINKRLNEVELTSANFATVTGFYSAAKDSVNASLRYINQSAFEWPYNHVEQEDVLTAGEIRYGYPADAKTVDFDSFRIKRSSSFGNETQKLKIISYEEYLERYDKAINPTRGRVSAEYRKEVSLNLLNDFLAVNGI